MMQDFTNAQSRKFQAWRILQAPGVWASIYSDRINKFGKYRSAIIFPEQLLGLQKAILYSVNAFNSNECTSLQIYRHNNWFMMYYDSSKGNKGINNINTLDEVYNFETMNHNTTDQATKLRLGSTGVEREVFVNTVYFANRKDALVYSQKLLQSYIG